MLASPGTGFQKEARCRFQLSLAALGLALPEDELISLELESEGKRLS